MNTEELKGLLKLTSAKMTENRDYLISLDQVNGDGDLGISMSEGFKAVSDYLDASTETDLGRALNGSGKAFNEAAPSSLGTILAFGFMGMAKALKGKSEADLLTMAQALEAGISNIMSRARSKEGEKTILDSLIPGVRALKENADKGVKEATALAAAAAAEGSENTRNMLSVHGRAAYYGEKSLGVLDGGSVVGRLIFEAVAEYSGN